MKGLNNSSHSNNTEINKHDKLFVEIIMVSLVELKCELKKKTNKKRKTIALIFNTITSI